MIVSRQSNENNLVGSVKDYGAIIVVCNSKKIPLQTFNNWEKFNSWLHKNNYIISDEKIYKSII